MSRSLRRDIPIPIGWFIGSSLLFSAALMALVFMGDALNHEGKLGKFGWEFAKEVVKAGAFGGILAALLHNRLESLFEGGPEAILHDHGIQNLYSSRERAADALVHWIQDPNITQVSIVGTSLRDLLPRGARLHHVWEAIRSRLEFEQSQTPPPFTRLRVKLLLLDPKSAEGMFRFQVENSALERGSLFEDVQNSIQRYRNTVLGIYKTQSSEFLELRLYEHCPFAFLVLTDEHALVEQYCYRDPTFAPAFPLHQFARKGQPYKQLEYSFGVIWQHAHGLDRQEHGVGTAKGVQAARITNIFRHDTRSSLGSRQLQCVRNARPGQVVRIGAITARYYFRDALEILREKTSPGAHQVSVQILILNPVSEAAILRAVSEMGAPAQVREVLDAWDWDQHRRSPLYHDGTHTLQMVQRLRERGHAMELRLTPVTPMCSIVQTPEALFVEQYLLGRGPRFETGALLGGEYPVFEFAAAQEGEASTTEEELVNSTFELLWQNLSLAVHDYGVVDDETQFTTNLNMLRASLSPMESGLEHASDAHLESG